MATLDSDESLHDPDLIPIYRKCSLCEMEYDFILKMESLYEDEEVMKRTLGLNRIKHTHEGTNLRGGKITDERRVQYFEVFNQAELDRLHHHFLPDFVLFEYTLEDAVGSAEERQKRVNSYRME